MPGEVADLRAEVWRRADPAAQAARIVELEATVRRYEAAGKVRDAAREKRRRADRVLDLRAERVETMRDEAMGAAERAAASAAEGARMLAELSERQVEVERAAAGQRLIVEGMKNRIKADGIAIDGLKARLALQEAEVRRLRKHLAVSTGAVGGRDREIAALSGRLADALAKVAAVERQLAATEAAARGAAVEQAAALKLAREGQREAGRAAEDLQAAIAARDEAEGRVGYYRNRCDSLVKRAREAEDAAAEAKREAAAGGKREQADFRHLRALMGPAGPASIRRHRERLAGWVDAGGPDVEVARTLAEAIESTEPGVARMRMIGMLSAMLGAV